MASAFPTTASAASAAKDCPPSHRNRLPIQRKVSFLLSSVPRLRFSSKGLQSGWNVCTVRKGQSNKAALGGSLNATTPLIKAELETEDKAANSSSVPSSPALASEESISEFIGQVANLVKLVDSRDIVELQLKQLDCELLIRKKEALPQSASPAPSYMMHSPPPTAAAPTFHALPPPPATPAPSPSATSPSSPPASSPAVKKSSLPSLKSPMAGTFYRSPAPTEPPFVKVGDKVQKGQVLCIIEAMKLMNEIEADQSGTIVEIVAEDGKPVSVDTPLFVIES